MKCCFHRSWDCVFFRLSHIQAKCQGRVRLSEWQDKAKTLRAHYQTFRICIIYFNCDLFSHNICELPHVPPLESRSAEQGEAIKRDLCLPPGTVNSM